MSDGGSKGGGVVDGVEELLVGGGQRVPVRGRGVREQIYDSLIAFYEGLFFCSEEE